MKDAGGEIVRLPYRSPNLNAYAERFVRSIKDECLDHMIFFGERSLRKATREYAAHYHRERNHRGIDNRLIEPGDTNHRIPGRIGYTKGVPMGGDLRNAPKGKSPTFLVAALKDPIGTNLDRIQIIKGWVDRDGKTQERIYDVAVSGGRKIGADGRCKTSVDNSVDAANATWTNTIGDPELITVWKDPDFDPSLNAFYYARVIEIPTPRWTAYDAKRFGVKMSEEVPMTTQERAYTSPIWYSP